jgi:hypothetical protein
MNKLTSRFVATFAVVGLSLVMVSPVAHATTTYSIAPGQSPSWDTGVSSNLPFTIGTGGSLSGQRMLFDMTGISTVTFTVVNEDPSANTVNFSNAECSFSSSSSKLEETAGGIAGARVIATLTSTPSPNSVNCTLVSTGLIGSQFYVRVPQAPSAVRVSPAIRFWLNNLSSGGSAPRVSANTAPVKYSGPEFNELSLKPVLSGTSTTLEGRKLNEISTITVDGKAAKLSDATDKSLKLELPAGLKPGVYDLVVTTASHGKLTHMNAIRIREEFPPTSLTIRGTGVLTGEEFKKLTAFARTQNPEMNTVTCIVNSGSEGKSFTMARALCGRIAQNNLNIKTTQLEVRSTVESSAVFARVVFSSVQ